MIRRICAIMAVVAMVATVTVACVPPADTTPGMHVSGNKIMNGSSVFVPNGANMGTTGSFNWSGDALGHSSSAVAWGWTAIRLDLYTDDIFATPGTAKSQAQKIIDEYTAKGIVVILASGWTCPKADGGAAGPGYDNPVTAANCPRTLAWMKDMAGVNKANSKVWYNCFNEIIADQQDWVNAQNACVDNVRAAGNNSIVVADAPGAAADIWWSGSIRVYEASMGPAVLAHDPKHNVVFSQHNYGGYCDAAGEGAYLDAMHNANLAVVIGEFGFFYPNTGQWYDCAIANFAAAPPRGVGLLVWHATMADGFWLRTAGQPFYGSSSLTDLGQRMWNVTH